MLTCFLLSFWGECDFVVSTMGNLLEFLSSRGVPWNNIKIEFEERKMQANIQKIYFH